MNSRCVGPALFAGKPTTVISQIYHIGVFALSGGFQSPKYFTYLEILDSQGFIKPSNLMADFEVIREISGYMNFSWIGSYLWWDSVAFT